jgi:hypothetical protein
MHIMTGWFLPRASIDGSSPQKAKANCDHFCSPPKTAPTPELIYNAAANTVDSATEREQVLMHRS